MQHEQITQEPWRGERYEFRLEPDGADLALRLNEFGAAGWSVKASGAAGVILERRIPPDAELYARADTRP